MDTFIEEEREVEKVKKADIATIRYRIRKYKISDIYLNITEVERLRREVELR